MDDDEIAALYSALGVRHDDERFRLVVLGDGRWALLGRRAEGEQFAFESAGPVAPTTWRAGRH